MITDTEVRTQIWQQWDKQEAARLALIQFRVQQQAYIRLNNLYLNIEAGVVKMSVGVMNTLYHDLSLAYPKDEQTMRDYWLSEFEKLPNWFEY